jgi:hypothetical protein
VEFFKIFREKFEAIIIERQVNINTVAMELMYATTATALSICRNIIIFDPKMKFTHLKIKYDTKNKNHKTQSVEIVKKYLNLNFPHLLKEM